MAVDWSSIVTQRWRKKSEEAARVLAAAAEGNTRDTEERIKIYIKRACTSGGLHARRCAANLAPSLAPSSAEDRAANLAEGGGVQFERAIGTSELLSVEFLQAGLNVARAVCRVRKAGGVGTGFLVGNDIFLTNHHVLASEEECDAAQLDFNAEENRVGPARHIEEFDLDPGRFFYTSSETDATLCAVHPVSNRGESLAGYGHLPLRAETGKILLGARVNIVGHPRGGLKQIAIRDNRLVNLDDLLCFYTADTKQGSSGSPVFNDDWEVVALHSRAISDGPHDQQHNQQSWVANAGVRASVLVAALERAELSPKHQKERAALIKLWQQSRLPLFTAESLPVGPGNPAAHQAVTLANGQTLSVEVKVRGV